jgi:hypothetical protein
VRTEAVADQSWSFLYSGVQFVRTEAVPDQSWSFIYESTPVIFIKAITPVLLDQDFLDMSSNCISVVIETRIMFVPLFQRRIFGFQYDKYCSYRAFPVSKTTPI